MWWFLLLACASKTSPSVEEPGSTTSTTVPTTIPEPPTDFDLGAAGAAVTDVAAIAATARAAPLLDLYEGLLALGDERCPAPDWGTAAYEYHYWYSQCTADSGAVFTGYAYWYASESPGRDYRQVYLGGGVIDPQGDAALGTGWWSDLATSEGALSRVEVTLHGSVLWEGADADDWLGRGLSTELTLERVTNQETGRRTLYADGAIGGLSGQIDTVVFHGASLASDAGCREPDGSASIHDLRGEWLEVTWDGSCEDGCGSATLRGAPVGQVCADFSPWLSFEEP